MEELTAVLRRERRLLELLVSRLAGAVRSTAADGHLPPRAAAEVRHAVDAVRAAELERALVVAGLGAGHGPAAEGTMDDLLAGARRPWRAVLAGHRWALLRLAAEVDERAGELRQLTGGDAGVVVALPSLDDFLRRGADRGSPPGPAARPATIRPSG